MSEYDDFIINLKIAEKRLLDKVNYETYMKIMEWIAFKRDSELYKYT